MIIRYQFWLYRSTLTILWIAFILLYVNLSLSNTLSGFADSSTYLMMSKWFSGDRSPASFYLMSTASFPPLFPLLIALYNALFGSGFQTEALIYQAHLLTVILLVLSGLLYSNWLVQQKVPTLLVFLLSLLYITSPTTIMLSFDILSEPLYLALVFLFLLINHCRPHRWSWIEALGFGVLIRLVMLTRSIGLTLLIAVVVNRLKHQWSAIPSLLIGFILPVMIWKSYKSLWGFEGDYQSALFGIYGLDELFVESSGVVDFTVKLLQHTPTILSVIYDHVRELLSAYLSLLSLRGASLSSMIMAVIGLFALIGCLQRLKHFQIDAWYCFIYLMISIFWPYSDHAQRFIWSLLPFVLFYAIDGSYQTFKLLNVRYLNQMASLFQSNLRFKKLTVIRLPMVVMLLALGLALPEHYKIFQRWQAAELWSDVGYTKTKRWYRRSTLEEAQRDATIRSQFYSQLAALSTYVAPKECIYFVWTPDVMLYANRISHYFPHVDNELALRNGHCNWFLVSALGRPFNRPPLYPLGLMRKEYIKTAIPNSVEIEGESRVISVLVEYSN